MSERSKWILAGVLGAIAVVLVAKRLGLFASGISGGEARFHEQVGEELGGLVAADHGPGAVLLILPSQEGRVDAPRAPILAGVRRVLGEPAWQVVDVTAPEEGAEGVQLDPVTGEFESGGFRMRDWAGWSEGRSPVAVISFRELPTDLDPAAAGAMPPFYLLVWGGGDAQLERLRRGPVAAAITYKGVWPGEGLRTEPVQVLPADQYQVVRF